MVSPVSLGASAVAFVVGIGLLGLAWYLYRTHDELGTSWYAASVCVLGATPVALGTTLLVLGDEAGFGGDGFGFPLITTATLSLYGSMYALFGVEYSGRAGPFTRQQGLAVVTLIVGIVLGLAVTDTFRMGPEILAFLVSVGADLMLISIVLAVGVGIYSVATAARRYGHLSVRAGVLPSLGFALVLFAPLILGNFVVGSGNAVPASQQLIVLSTGYGLVGVCLALPPVRWDLFDATPAVGEVGRTQFVEDTENLVAVVDDDGQLIELNQTALDRLDIDEERVLGGPLTELVDADVATLAATDVYELETVDGQRAFKPQVSVLTDQHDERLGHILTFTDITERRIREQRLAVLNRVVRHNLRNTLTQVKGFTEVAADKTGDDEITDHLEKSLEATDELMTLGERAREAEQLMETEESPGRSFTLASVVRDAVESCKRDHPDAAISVSVDDASLQATRAPFYHVVTNLLDNALEHNDTDEPTASVSVLVDAESDYPVQLTVDDDGPGIPQHELDTIEEGEETALKHGSGLGLWITNWCVQQLGGQLEFDTGIDGTTATVRLPHTPIDASAAKSDVASPEPVATD